jgi:hypothetical protein
MSTWRKSSNTKVEFWGMTQQTRGAASQRSQIYFDLDISISLYKSREKKESKFGG